jgi:phage recombination protein Bet
MATTTTKTDQQTNSRPMPPPLKPAESKGQVAVIAPLRMAFPEVYKKEFEITETDWRALTDAVFPGARTIEAVGMALAYCKKRNLDIFKRPVHIVSIYSAALKKTVESVWPGINELRTTAMRTNNYAGMEKPEYGPMIKKVFGGGKVKRRNDHGDDYWAEEPTIELEFPEWCEITVHRFVQGHKVTFPGPRVYWLETYATKGHFSTLPNDMWEKRSNGQLEKCAEAAALRRAFPEEIGDDHVIEELGAFNRTEPVDITETGSVTVGKETPPEPTRESVKKESATPTSADTGQAAKTSPAAGGGDSTAKATPPDAKPEAAAQPEIKPKTGKRKTKAKPVTDVVDQNQAAGKETGPDDGAATEQEQAAAAGQPEKPEPLIFEPYKRAGDFFIFSDPFLEDPKRTPDEARQWEAFYRNYIKNMSEQGSPAAKEALASTIGLYSAVLAREKPE